MELTYNEFINNILETRGRFACGEEYHERHHIVPRCMGGTDDDENLIDLFAKEHFIAHSLLTKENPDNEKLVYAWSMMAFVKSDNQERYELSPEEYEEIKITVSNMRSEKYSGEQNPMYGVRRYGADNPNYGNHYSKETRLKISIAASNRSEETRKKMSESMKKRFSDPKNCPMYGWSPSDETRKKMSESAKARSTEDYRMNLSEQKKKLFANPENHPFYGKSHSKETKEKISNTLKEYFENIENHPNYGTGVTVVQLTLDDQFISEYKSAADASRHTKIDRSSIRRCCIGEQKTAGGFKWMYKEEWEEMQNAKNINGKN
jgi:group I intron endonuclease